MPEVVVLVPPAGLAHLSALVFCSLRISLLRSPRAGVKYRLRGFARALKFSSVLAAISCLLILLFQFNARLAADPDPLLEGTIAPFEWAREALLLRRVSSWSVRTLLDAFVNKHDQALTERLLLGMGLPFIIIFSKFQGARILTHDLGGDGNESFEAGEGLSRPVCVGEASGIFSRVFHHGTGNVCWKSGLLDDSEGRIQALLLTFVRSTTVPLASTASSLDRIRFALHT